MNKLQTSAPRKTKGISYAKWGYIFIAPFFYQLCYIYLVSPAAHHLEQ